MDPETGIIETPPPDPVATLDGIDTDDYTTVIKSLGEDRIGGYLCVWGSKAQKDLTGEYFTPDTEGLTEVFDQMGKLPVLYHHGADVDDPAKKIKGMKATLVGAIDVMEKDE